MRKILALFCLVFAFGSEAANFNTITLTFTNIATNGCTVTVNGNVIRWTNAPLDSVTWIQTNGIAGSATNLTRRLGAQYPQLRTQQTNGTNIIIAGSGLTVAIFGNYGFLTTNSLLQTNSILFTLPWSTQFETNRTNNAEELIYGLDRYPRTNAFRADSQVLTNFTGITNQQVLYNKKLMNAIVKGGTNDSMAFTNISSAGLSNVTAEVYNLKGSGTVSNAAVLNMSTASGIIGNLTNGILQSPKLTNATINATAGYLLNVSAENLNVTNLNPFGSGLNSVKIGVASLASGTSDIGIGVSASAAGGGATAVGPGARALESGAAAFGTGDAFYENGLALGNATANHTNATAIGNGSTVDHPDSTALNGGTTTAANQIRLGTDTHHVSIPGEIREVKYTNAWSTGTNRFDGAIKLTGTNVTGVANGDILLDVGLLRTVHRLSGNSAAVNICGIKYGYGDRQMRIIKTNIYDLVFKNLSGAAGTAVTERILTGTGGNVTFTNVPEVIDLSYDPEQAVWFLHRPQ